VKRVVILHRPDTEGAIAFAREAVARFARLGVDAVYADVWSDEAADLLDGGDFLVCAGGDGTVLRGARINIGYGLPILGVNLGRLGFLTDVDTRAFFANLDRIVEGDWRLEERVMVRGEYTGEDGDLAVYHGLNDIYVSRRAPGRPIYVDLAIDCARVAVYRCDGIIVSTPTGSTGYSLAAGGPILVPTEHHLVLTPVSAHLALARSIVLQPQTEVEMLVTSDHGATLSVDGQEDVPLASGTRVRARMSEHVTRFARLRAPESFYAELAEKLESQLVSAMVRS
jgi:NAD+ kinase